MVSGNHFNQQPPHMHICTFSWQGGTPFEGSKEAVSILVGWYDLEPAIIVQELVHPADLLSI